jgi:hypothetical protein
MHNYCIKTPMFLVSGNSHPIQDRVFVIAKDPAEALELGVAKLKESGSEFMFYCMIYNEDPSNQLEIVEYPRPLSAGAPEMFSGAFDLYAAAKASSLRAENLSLTVINSRLKMLAIASFLLWLFIGLMFIKHMENEDHEYAIAQQSKVTK